MNNCYGKNEDMQQRLVDIYPEVGNRFQILICVPDTDDGECIIEFLTDWIEAHVNLVDHFEIADTDQPDSRFTLITKQTDCFDNEFELYGPEHFIYTKGEHLI